MENKRSQILCRFYQNGNCMFNSNCEFGHDFENCIPVPSSICWFNLKSTCLNNSCAHIHVNIDDLLNKASKKYIENNENKAINCQEINSTDKLCSNINNEFNLKNETDSISPDELNRLKKLTICPFAASDSNCPDPCEYELHGNQCSYCNKFCLHPYDSEQRQRHIEECIVHHEDEMEYAFAIKESQEKDCSICMENVLSKEDFHQRVFGLLEKCNHVFCLSCIRKWRKSNNVQTKKMCPECRIVSDFVIPSKFWIGNPNLKTKVIKNYKDALSKVHCKYFKRGQGECPFRKFCFYLHALPDGTVVEKKTRQTQERDNRESINQEQYLRIFIYSNSFVRSIFRMIWT